MTAAFDNMHQGFMLLDNQGRVTNFNPRLGEIIGYPPGVLRVGATARDLIDGSAALGHYPGASAEQAYEAWSGRLGAGRPGYHIGRSLDGRTIGIGYAPYGNGQWVLTYEDISARVDAETALAEQNQRLDAALTNMPHGVCMFDADKRLIVCNSAYSQLYALPPELTLAGTPLRRILEHRAATGSAPIEMQSYFDVAEEAEAAGDSRDGRVELQDGRTVRIAYNPMSGGGYVATHEDISKAVQAEETIRHMGSHDSLTGLPNRSLLRDLIGEAMIRTRPGGLFCVHYIDLDDFRTVNDTHGRPVGDAVLKQIAKRLRLCLRDADALARVGGDEFVALQADLAKPEQAGILARRLVEAISPVLN